MSPDGSTKSPLPEEKLLRLIRGKGARPESGAPAPAAAAGKDSLAAVPAVGLQSGGRTSPWPRLAVACLGVALGLEVVVLIIQVVRPIPVIRRPVPTAQTPAAAGPTTNPPPEVPSLAASASRPLFSMPTASPDAAPVTGTRPAPSGSAKLLASRLTLLGIVPGDPAQAIIEDAQTKKTYFVTTGQSVVEGAVLERVLENHVILDLQGEKIELTL